MPALLEFCRTGVQNTLARLLARALELIQRRLLRVLLLPGPSLQRGERAHRPTSCGHCTDTSPAFPNALSRHLFPLSTLSVLLFYLLDSNGNISPLFSPRPPLLLSSHRDFCAWRPLSDRLD